MQTIKRDSPSYHRNINPIIDAFRQLFPAHAANVLEVGSGSGQHVASLAQEFPDCRFHPSEVLKEDLASIDAWVKEAACTNVAKAQNLDVMDCPWKLQPNTGYDLLYCLNVIHITPWALTEKLFEGAAGVLNQNAKVFLYGPFMRDGKHTSPSNVDFDAWLKAKDSRFGVRDLDEVSAVAGRHGFQCVKAHDMPANNFIVEFSLA